MKDVMNETWVRLAKHETSWNHYEVSNMGNVRTVRKKTGAIKIRKLSVNGKNMPMLNISHKTFYIRNLMIEAGLAIETEITKI